MRLFFAVDLPEDLADPLAALQAEFGAAEGLRVTDPEQAHVTMQFLGEVDTAGAEANGDGRLRDVKRAGAAAVDAAALDPFEVEVGGLGVFPSPEYISVLWTGVREGGDQLTRLQAALEAETVDLGFEPDEHDFTPHITLARMDDARGKDLIQEALRERDPTVGRFEVSELRLKRSTLTDEGSEYDTVARFPL
jgi:2'-5' RNA ligase